MALALQMCLYLVSIHAYSDLCLKFPQCTRMARTDMTTRRVGLNPISFNVQTHTESALCFLWSFLRILFRYAVCVLCVIHSDNTGQLRVWALSVMTVPDKNIFKKNFLCIYMFTYHNKRQQRQQKRKEERKKERREKRLHTRIVRHHLPQ